ncbi:MAG: methionine aminopeptidase [Microbacteriaceae bacterium]|jgi:hypothetical protein|nr:MAG: methionine aminopeptidase [Microbacteriaceae bacterium BACL25 MAG-120322-bin65]|tara:strand:- start:1465 stop:1641 length:177 start_codon:yes stop_codon:yes gene_type:complete
MSDTVQWWFNNKTGEVESGKQSLGLDLDGPFATKEEAQRAPEIARERSRAWAEEESRD